MVEITLDLNVDIHENANKYFSKAKKIKAKLPGVEKIIEKTKVEITEFEKNKEEYIKKKEIKLKIKENKKQQWFEKFRYSYTSGGYLFVFGKDAGTNEVLLKKHATQNDIIFHTEAPGSPFGVVKEAVKIEGENRTVLLDKRELNEVAQVISCFSSQWKKGFGTADAFWVYLDQVSKKANTGEYIAKGGFMVRGDKNIIKNNILQIAVGVEKKEIENDDEDTTKAYYYELFSGSEEAVKKKCGQRYVKLEPGQDKYKVIGKEIKKRLKVDIEDLPTWIPNGSKVLKK
jgi:predicted ribosome quality control (RQC) complex YloA/Tae2 family protein